MCAWLLLQAYHKTRYRLLFWCSLFFSVAALNNIFLVMDKLVFPDVDLTRLPLCRGPCRSIDSLARRLILERE